MFGRVLLDRMELRARDLLAMCVPPDRRARPTERDRANPGIPAVRQFRNDSYVERRYVQAIETLNRPFSIWQAVLQSRPDADRQTVERLVDAINDTQSWEILSVGR